MNKAEKYDMKEAYNKNLTEKARFDYLKNEMADKKGPAMYGYKSPMEMKGSWMSKHCSK